MSNWGYSINNGMYWTRDENETYYTQTFELLCIHINRHIIYNLRCELFAFSVFFEARIFLFRYY